MRWILSLVLVVALGVGYSVLAEEAAKSTTTCPVSGKAAVADKSVEFTGGKVTFCCDGCKAKFEKDNTAFAGKARAQLVATGQFEQKACPFSGGPVKDGTQIDVAGCKVGFCCNNCKGKAEKATGDDQINLIFTEKGLAQGFAKK
jgi:hypothetical protein